MPLKSGSVIDNEFMRGRSNQGLISIEKTAVAPPPPVPSNLYAGLNVSPGKIVKMSLGFERVGVLTVPGTLGFLNLITSGNYLYAPDRSAPSILKKIDLSTFQVADSLTLPSGVNDPEGVTIVANYLYIMGNLTVIKIAKVNLATFSTENTLTFPLAENTPSMAVISGNYLYVNCFLFPPDGHIAKVDLSTFTRVGYVAPCLSERPAGMAVSGNYLYVSEYGTTRIVHKIDLSTFTEVDTLTLPSGDTWLFDLVVSGNYLYVGRYTSSPTIIKVDLTTFSKVDSLNLAAGEDWIHDLYIVGDYLYAGLDLNPAQVVKIDLKTFSRVSTVIFLGGEDSIGPHNSLAA